MTTEIKKRKNFRKFDGLLYPLIVLAGIVIFLEIALRVFKLPETVFPTPIKVIIVLLNKFNTEVFPHFLITIQVIIIGILVAIPLGLLAAALLSQYKIMNKTFSPYVICWVTMPMIATVPLFMMWLGYGLFTRILMVSIQVSSMVALNSIAGFNKIEQDKLELMASLGAGKWTTFFKCIFPNSLPSVFAGIRLGCINATMTEIGIELTGFNSGIGTRVMIFATMVDTPLVFACILMTIILGILLFKTVSFIESRVVYWKG